MTAFDTPVDATVTPYVQTYDELLSEVISLKSNLTSMTSNWEYASGKQRELVQKIANVKGHIFDMYSMNGEVDDDIKEIARLLDITLMKEIAGTATFEISWTAQVPLDFDADDFEITFDVNCETYEAEEFDWNEDNCEVNGEDV